MNIDKSIGVIKGKEFYDKSIFDKGDPVIYMKYDPRIGEVKQRGYIDKVGDIDEANKTVSYDVIDTKSGDLVPNLINKSRYNGFIGKDVLYDVYTHNEMLKDEKDKPDNKRKTPRLGHIEDPNHIITRYDKGDPIRAYINGKFHNASVDKVNNDRTKNKNGTYNDDGTFDISLGNKIIPNFDYDSMMYNVPAHNKMDKAVNDRIGNLTEKVVSQNNLPSEIGDIIKAYKGKDPLYPTVPARGGRKTKKSKKTRKTKKSRKAKKRYTKRKV